MKQLAGVLGAAAVLVAAAAAETTYLTAGAFFDPVS